MRKRQSIMIGLTGIMLACTLIGCSKEKTAAPASEPAKQETAKQEDGAKAEGGSEAESKSEPITLRFSWWGNDSRHEKTLAVIDMYQKLHPNITIEPEYRGKSEREKVATELGSGTCADIVQLNPPWMGDFTSNGDFFVDLSQYGKQIDLEGFDQKLLKNYCYYNDTLIALPSGLNARTYLVNKTKLAELQINCDMSSEWTWDSLLEIGKTVNSKNSSQYFLNADKVDMTEFVLRPYIIQKTGKALISDDYELGFTKENLTDALGYISQLYEQKVVVPAADGNTFLNSVWTNPEWLNGNLMTELSWTSLIDGATSDMEDEWGTTTLPVAKDAVDTAIVVKPSQLFAITKTSQNPEAAADFLNFFLTNEEAGLELADCRGIPPYNKVQTACQNAQILNPSVIEATQYAQEHAGLYENAASTNAEITTVLNDAVEAVSYDPTSIDAQAEQAMALIDDILSSMK